MVEVIIRVADAGVRVRVTVEIDPVAGGADLGQSTEIADGAQGLANGRTLPRLLFATDGVRLATNVGADTLAAARSLVETAGHAWTDTSASSDPMATIHASAAGVAGIVLLGGYDVLPALRFDVLPPELRQQLGSQVSHDPDSYVVWGDQGLRISTRTEWRKFQFPGFPTLHQRPC